MKQIHFRIVELPTHQVLLTKDFDEDDSSPQIIITFFSDGVKVEQKLGYSDVQKRDKYFDEIPDDQVQTTIDGVLKYLK